MKYPVYTVLLAALLSPAFEVQARIYQTSDAIIVEAEDFSSERQGRSMSNEPAVSENSVESPRVFPGGTFLMTERSCWTPDGRLGSCSSLRSCYPDAKLSSTNSLDSWFLASRATCVYAEGDGRQIVGVCCPVRQFPQFPGIQSNPGFPMGIPWWPSFIPFGPQFGINPIGAGVPVAPPVQPPTSTASPPSTTSPWWVPDSTTSRPGTTSPWWVPDSSTAKPATTTASPASTTRPASVPDSSTSTASTVGAGPPVVEPVLTGSKGACGAGPFKALSLDEQKRIVGGTTAVKNSWPFVVAMFNNGRQFCGGSLLDPTHILTAAHCIAHMSSTDVARLEVALGMHTLKPYDGQAVRKRVRRIVRHKGFNSRTLYNDVAVMTLDSPIKFSRSISPVCLPSSGSQDQYVGREAVVVGWGALKEGGKQPDVLQQVTVQIQSNAQCKANYGSDAPGGIVDHMICAAYPGKDSCSGDSGGPMIVQASPGSPWVQTGIVSWGIGCGKAPYPGVYSRVTSFMDWIVKNAQ